MTELPTEQPLSKPDPLGHMLAWCLLGGFVVALFYMALIFDLYFTLTGETFNSLALLFNPLGWLLAGIFGMIPGGIIGTVTGFAMRRMMRPVDMPYVRDDMNRQRTRVYGVNGALAGTLILLFAMVMFPQNGGLLLWGVPPLLAMGIAAYAGHRYLLRLVTLSQRTVRKRKEKNDARASERLTLPETADDIIEVDEDTKDSILASTQTGSNPS